MSNYVATRDYENGGSIILDGTADYMLNQSFFFGTNQWNPDVSQSFAIGLWVKPNDIASGQQTLFAKYQHSSFGVNNKGYYCAITSAGKVTFRIEQNSLNFFQATTANQVCFDDTWTHVFIRHDGNALGIGATHPQIFINGVGVTYSLLTTATLLGDTKSTQNFNIGRLMTGVGPNTWSQYFDGKIADMCFYWLANPTQAEIQQIYMGGPKNLDKTVLYKQQFLAAGFYHWVPHYETNEKNNRIQFLGSNYQQDHLAKGVAVNVISAVVGNYSLQEVSIPDSALSKDSPSRDGY